MADLSDLETLENVMQTLDNAVSEACAAARDAAEQGKVLGIDLGHDLDKLADLMEALADVQIGEVRSQVEALMGEAEDAEEEEAKALEASAGSGLAFGAETLRNAGTG